MGAPQFEQAGADISGGGTPNTIPRWTGPTTLGDSLLSQSGTIVSAASAFRVAAGTNWSTNDGGLLLFSNNGYKIGFDSVGSTVGYIRYQVDTAGSTLHGHMFSAGALGSPTNLMFIRSDGNVGIGTTSPGHRLDVANSAADAIARIVTTNAASSAQLILQGTSFGQIVNTVGEFFLTNASAAGNMIFRTGSGTERARIDSAGRMCIGTTTATAGRALTTVADLDVFGVRVGRGSGDDAESTALGAGALAAQTSGARHNTAVGKNAGASIQGGGWNVAIGNNALQAHVSANNSVAVGSSALYSATAGSNVAVGANALYFNTSGTTNCAIGAYCLFNLGTTSNNVAFGNESGRFFGAGSSALTAATDSIFIGADARANANSETNQIVIGKSAVGNGSNTVTIGNSSNVGTFFDTKYVRLVDSYTVGTLPAAGTAGRIARVTDGDAGLAWGATVVNTGAGATPYLVWDNGTNWTVFGK